MNEQFKANSQNQLTIHKYYEDGERGYWDFLKGRCHYGFSDTDAETNFDMERAQIAMERKLGKKLDLPAGSMVLDAGCGYGPVSRTLSNEFGLNIVGIDLIHKRLKQNAMLNQANEQSINLTNADYHHLPFPDETLDGIFTMETLVHAADHKQVLSEFLRVLKPGGKVVLFEYSIPSLESVPTLARKLAENVIRKTGMLSLPDFTHGSFSSILSEAGFEKPIIEEISENVYPSWHYMYKFAISVVLEELAKGTLTLDKVPGSLWIWPARKRLGYNICQAIKPNSTLSYNVDQS